MSWRGGDRFQRCLNSITASREFFDRVVISVTSAPDSADMRAAHEFQKHVRDIEVICTGEELPTMQHQAFWVNYLQSSGVRGDDWIYWLAYDDEVRPRGIEAIVDEQGNWPLTTGTAYFGPWAMRHESPDDLWAGDPTSPLESWTSFPSNGPTRLPAVKWLTDQLKQPTYMQMSGSVNPFRSFTDLRDLRPRKQGPMRIEMAIATATGITHVEEFDEPVSIIYGRSNSDRASYGAAARREDVHLAAWLGRYSLHHPKALPGLAAAGTRFLSSTITSRIGVNHLPEEEWRVRGEVLP